MHFIKKMLLPWCLSFCLTGAAVAERDNPEYKVKAGYLYNFIKFITWPSEHFATFNICILGRDPFGTLLAPIEARTAFGAPIKLLRLQSPAMTQLCQIVFIGTDNIAPIADKPPLAFSNGGKTLVVGEGEGFAEQGGMIAFVNEQGKVKLHINLNSLQKSSLSISAKLLEVAQIVGDKNND